MHSISGTRGQKHKSASQANNKKNTKSCQNKAETFMCSKIIPSNLILELQLNVKAEDYAILQKVIIWV